MVAVPLYGQKYPNSCWAASMRMILASKARFVANDDAIASPTNDQASLASGLDPNATACLTHWGFRTLFPACYTPEGFMGLVARYGALWVACDVRFVGATRSSPHIRVVTGVRNLQSPMLLQVNDPGPVGFGSQYEETYPDFMRKNELLGSGEMKEPGPIYIAYLV